MKKLIIISIALLFTTAFNHASAQKNDKEAKKLVQKWFSYWEDGDYLNLPVTDDFKHTSPFGTINGKADYIRTVEANRENFIGYTFKIHDGFYSKDKACVRYTGTKEDFKLDVSEWYYFKDGLIQEIVSYYHIGEIREDHKIDYPDDY